MLLRRLAARGPRQQQQQQLRGELAPLYALAASGGQHRALGSTRRGAAAAAAAASPNRAATYPASTAGGRQRGRGGGHGGRKRPLPGRASVVSAGWRESAVAGAVGAGAGGHGGGVGSTVGGAVAAGTAPGMAAAAATAAAPPPPLSMGGGAPLPVCDRGVLPADSPLRAAILRPLEAGDVAAAVQALQAAAEARQQVDPALALRLLDAARGRWHLVVHGLFACPAFPVEERVVLHALRGCVATRRWRPAVAILEEALPRRGLAPSAAAYRQALLACGLCQESGQALRLLEAMAARGLVPGSRDIGTLHALVAEAAAAGAWDGALALCRYYFAAPPPTAGPGGGAALQPRLEREMVHAAVGACKRAVGEAYARNERALYGPMAERLWEVVRLARERRPGSEMALSRWAWGALVKVASRAGRVGDVTQIVEAMAAEGVPGAAEEAEAALLGGRGPGSGGGGGREAAAAGAEQGVAGEGRWLGRLQWCLGHVDWAGARAVLEQMAGAEKEEREGRGGGRQGPTWLPPPPSEPLVAAVLDCGLRGRMEAEALAVFEGWLARDGDFVPSAAARVMAVRACLRLLEEEREREGWPVPTPATFAGRVADDDADDYGDDEDGDEAAKATAVTSAAEAGLRGSAAVRQLGALLDQFEARTPGQRGVACGLAMEQLKRHGQVKEALALLAALRALEVPRGPAVLLPLLQLCARAGRLQELVALVEGMERGVDGVVPTTAAYAEAVEATARAGMVQDSLRLHRAMRARGHMASEALAAIVMSAVARRGDWETAVAFLGELKEGGGPLGRSVVLHTSAIDACGNGGAWGTALELLARMEAEGVAPNNFTFTAAIKACGRAGQWDEAAALFAQMEARGLPINEVTYVALLDAHAKASRWEDAAATIRTMERRGVRPTTPHYTAAIDACSRAGRYREALAWLAEMEARDVPITRVAYTAAVFACGRGGAWDEALRLLMRMLPRAGERPSGISYMLAIDACGRAGQWPVAAYLWDLVEMVDPNELALPVLNSLVCAMDDPALAGMVDTYYARAYAQGQVNHWSVRWAGVMDLHNLSRPLAKAALRHVLRRMVARYAGAVGEAAGGTEAAAAAAVSSSRENGGGGGGGYVQDPRKPLVIVTGHGRHRDAGRSVLREELTEFLATEFDPPLRARGVAFNQGRMQVAPADLLRYARAQLGLPPLLDPVGAGAGAGAGAEGAGGQRPQLQWGRVQGEVEDMARRVRRLREQMSGENRKRTQDRARRAPTPPPRWPK